jgi:hypothetical protein
VSTTLPNNPAARLLSLYSAGRQSDLPSKKSQKVWAELLDVPENDLPLLLKRIGQVAGLAQDVKEKTSRLKGLKPENLITWIPKTLGPFRNFNLDNQFQHFLTPVDENVMSLLQICSDALDNQLPEPTINREQLKELRNQIADFVSSISNLALPDQAKEFLLKHAAIIDNALIDYQLQGFDALTAGLERAIGHSALNRRSIHEWEAVSPSPFK